MDESVRFWSDLLSVFIRDLFTQFRSAFQLQTLYRFGLWMQTCLKKCFLQPFVHPLKHGKKHFVTTYLPFSSIAASNLLLSVRMQWKCHYIPLVCNTSAFATLGRPESRKLQPKRATPKSKTMVDNKSHWHWMFMRKCSTVKCLLRVAC